MLRAALATFAAFALLFGVVRGRAQDGVADDCGSADKAVTGRCVARAASKLPANARPSFPLAPGAGTGTMSVRDSVRWLGRADLRQMNSPAFSWSYSGFAVHFFGTGLRVKLLNATGYHFIVVVDGKPIRRFLTYRGLGTYDVVQNLSNAEHLAEVRRESEGQYGASTLLGFGQAVILPPTVGPARVIEIIGDSTSCGYGILGEEHHAPERNDRCTFSFFTESAYDSYGAIAARELGAELSVVAVSGWGVVRGHDQTAEKNVPSVYDRIIADQASPTWHFEDDPQVVVINLGANDLKPPAPSDPGKQVFMARYRRFLARVRSIRPQAWVICAVGPTLSDDWPPDIEARSLMRERLRAIVNERRAQGDERVSLLEFPRHNTAQTGCDYHPSRAQHEAMAAILVGEIRRIAGW